MLGCTGFEDREGHQAASRTSLSRLGESSALGSRDGMPAASPVRLTQYAAGGGCACKIPPGELERGAEPGSAGGRASGDLLVGLDDGDDAAAVRIDRRPTAPAGR